MRFKYFSYSSAHLLRSILLYKKSSSLLNSKKAEKETKSASGSFIWEPLLTKRHKRNCAKIMYGFYLDINMYIDLECAGLLGKFYDRFGILWLLNKAA